MPPIHAAPFQADVTVPIGHPLMGGGIAPAREVADPLEARGIVFLGSGSPIVFLSIDWCEIRNDAHARWRHALAEAAQTTPDRVLVSAVHVHDAPIADLEAQRLLEASGAAGAICQIPFHEQAVQAVARALRDVVPGAKPLTHIGTGRAPVEQIASNRRYLLPDGAPAFGRTSATRDPYAREQPEGTVDPELRALSFWSGDQPIATFYHYATHPMSHYGKGLVSADFVGQARRQRQAEQPGGFAVYVSGCSGNVTAGKYNDGDPQNRASLAARLHQAMVRADETATRHPLGQLGFRSARVRLEPRDDPGFSVAELQKRLADGPRPFDQCLAALGLSWRRRADAGATIDLPLLDFGPAQWLLLPAESYVEFQLYAQTLRPDSFVAVAGYGECAPGYIPTDRHIDENDTNLHDWCWVARGSEGRLKAALERLLVSAKPAGVVTPGAAPE
jgi:hypothetical protein